MLVFFTDLDGTLLDHHSYDWQPARPAIHHLQSLHHALVLTTSKARAEVTQLHAAMGLADPIIIENGGALCLPPGYFGAPPEGSLPRDGWDLIELGTPYPVLVEALRHAAAASGVHARGFSEMEVEEVARRTGLPLETARLSHQREYDEPFVVEEGDPAVLCSAIEAAGFQWTRGGRFFHIIQRCDKAKAVHALTALYRRHRPLERTIGLGDGLNDAKFLRAVDSAWLIPSAQTTQLALLVPNVRIAPHPGPAGWAHAVTAELAV